MSEQLASYTISVDTTTGINSLQKFDKALDTTGQHALHTNRILNQVDLSKTKKAVADYQTAISSLGGLSGQLPGKLGAVSSSVGQLGNTFKTVGPTVGVVATGIAALAGAATIGAQQFRELFTQSLQLNRTLAAVGSQTKITADQWEKISNQIYLATGITRDQAIPIFNKFLLTVKDVGKAEFATKMAGEISKVTGNLTEAGTLYNNILARKGEIEETSLINLGIEARYTKESLAGLTDNVRIQEKLLGRKKNHLVIQAEILQMVIKQKEAALTDPLVEKTRELSVAWDGVKTSLAPIGKVLQDIAVAVLPVISNVINRITDTVDYLVTRLEMGWEYLSSWFTGNTKGLEDRLNKIYSDYQERSKARLGQTDKGNPQEKELLELRRLLAEVQGQIGKSLAESAAAIKDQNKGLTEQQQYWKNIRDYVDDITKGKNVQQKMDQVWALIEEARKARGFVENSFLKEIIRLTGGPATAYDLLKYAGLDFKGWQYAVDNKTTGALSDLKNNVFELAFEFTNLEQLFLQGTITAETAAVGLGKLADEAERLIALGVALDSFPDPVIGKIVGRLPTQGNDLSGGPNSQWGSNSYGVPGQGRQLPYPKPQFPDPSGISDIAKNLSEQMGLEDLQLAFTDPAFMEFFDKFYEGSTIYSLAAQTIQQGSEAISRSFVAMVLSGKGSLKDFKKALGDMLASIAIEQYARSLTALAMGAIASTPWGMAALGPPPPYYQAAAVHAVAGTVALAGAKLLGSSMGGGMQGGGKKGAGGGKKNQLSPTPEQKPINLTVVIDHSGYVQDMDGLVRDIQSGVNKSLLQGTRRK